MALSAPGSFLLLPCGRADASWWRSGMPSRVGLGILEGRMFEMQLSCVIARSRLTPVARVGEGWWGSRMTNRENTLQ